ncbi:ABC transporter substrate-binding protein [Tessaracoccus defluvii]|uniref:Extracellular solute-binding protein n=1 Tax=Tessaracoccus defluvii TaxID=1285901 RepID=A0A7H0H5F9_9ACTN|nr:extracellular solute-binding protein [Tessaracoccus defluvii]QNP55775.1 extracellular solute-binding protein [Tessaracoccus defluvii]
MSTVNRRSFMNLTAGGLAAAAVAGCTPGGGANPTSPGTAGGSSPASSPATQGGGSAALKVGWYGGAPVHEAMDSALKAFTSANPGITTTGTGVAFGDYWDKLATETAGGSGPDVFRMSMTYFVEYASRGALDDLTSASVIDTATLDADVKASGMVDGKLMGIGQSSIAPALFSSSAMLDKVGATVPVEWTWDEFSAWAKDYSAEAGAGMYGSSDMAGNFQMFDVFAREHVGNQFNDDGTLRLDAAVVEAWFALWDDLRLAKAAPPQDVTSAAGTFETNPMTTGTAALTSGWIQQMTFFQPLIKDSVVAASPLPQKTKGDFSGMFVKALDFWCVSAQSKHKEEAAKLVNHLINDPTATEPIGLLLGVPPTVGAREQLAGAAPAVQAAVKYVETYAPKAGKAPGPWPRGYGEVMSAFQRAAESVGFATAKPGDAATTFIDEAKSALGA